MSQPIPISSSQPKMKVLLYPGTEQLNFPLPAIITPSTYPETQQQIKEKMIADFSLLNIKK